MPLATGLHGQNRKVLLQLHRLLAFQEAFDDYLAGRVDAAFVSIRAKKMLEVGLPDFKNKRR